jgi:hypothetical protein
MKDNYNYSNNTFSNYNFSKFPNKEGT